jgi:hypothetical protein
MAMLFTQWPCMSRLRTITPVSGSHTCVAVLNDYTISQVITRLSVGEGSMRTFIVLSCELLTRKLFPVQRTQVTLLLWPLRVRSSDDVSAFHTCNQRYWHSVRFRGGGRLPFVAARAVDVQTESRFQNEELTFNVLSLLDDTSCALSEPMWMGCQHMHVMNAV